MGAGNHVSEIDVTAYDFLDFPTAWAIQRAGGLDHHPRCSSVPGWDPISGPGFLCDCGAIEAEWKRLRREKGLSED
jgi:hypothetical protein